MRLDKYLCGENPELSRTKVKELIEEGKVTVDGVVCKKSSSKVSDENKVLLEWDGEEEVEIRHEKDLNLPIIFECDDFVVVNKPFGMIVHPSASGGMSGTVVNALLNKIKDGVGEDMRPGIVHRLDKDTSGVMVVAKTKKGYEHLVKQFKNRKVKKFYQAVVIGFLENRSGVIESPIARDAKSRKKMAISSETNGKYAKTGYKVVEEFVFEGKKGCSFLDVEIFTGRTHQIRVHMAAIGHPVVGDGVYGLRSFNEKMRDDFGLTRQFLHAARLEFIDLNGKKQIFVADLPSDLNSVLDSLQGVKP